MINPKASRSEAFFLCTHIDIFCLRIYYAFMKILFAAIFIMALIAAAVFAATAFKRRCREQMLRAAVCCCIAVCSALGFAMSAPLPDAAVSAVHVTVSPAEHTPSPSETADPTQAQGAYTASSASDRFHLPSCSSAAKISDDNRLWFSSREEAVSAGYTPCGRCEP